MRRDPFTTRKWTRHPFVFKHAQKLAHKGHNTRALQAYLGHRNIQHTGAIHRVVAGQVQGLLALTDMAGLDTGSTGSRRTFGEISLACWQPATQLNPPLPEGRFLDKMPFLTLGGEYVAAIKNGRQDERGESPP